MDLLEMLFGSPGKQGSTYNKGQLSFLDRLKDDLRSMKGGAQDITQNQNYQSGQNWLQSLFSDPDFFKSFEAPLMRQFEENTIPDLANRFAGMGSGGSMGSTAFRNQANREAGNLHTNIAALRGGLQQQGVNQSLNYAQQPFQNYLQLMNQALTPTQNTYSQPTGGLLGPAVSSFIGGLGSGYGQKWGESMYG